MVFNLVKLQELSLVPPLFDRLILMVSGFVSLILPENVLLGNPSGHIWMET